MGIDSPRNLTWKHVKVEQVALIIVTCNAVNYTRHYISNIVSNLLPLVIVLVNIVVKSVSK